MRILLVWQNDGLIGIYRDTPRGYGQARARMRKVRTQGTHDDWARVRPDAWWQRTGPIARLCIERAEVAS